MTQAIIRAAFETRLATWAAAQVPALPVAFQNVDFAPPVTTFLRALLIPARTESLFMDLTGRDYKGIFQINIHAPLGDDVGPSETLLSALDALFPSVFTYSGLMVTLLAPMSASAPFPLADRYVTPVSATYRAMAI